ncbi:PAS domain-containing protein [Halomicroarcula sp. GCM10025894]|uniref:PAS domain-containing protein n=1 Tax=Halomicroarcula sp. GCM10025894 TaxID=3252673 RepID=UPI0036186233
MTERVVRERELSESRNRYRTLVENFPNGAVTLVDRDLRYTMVGGTPIDVAETTARELQGQKLTAALPAALADLLVPHYRAALDGEERSFSGAIGGHDYRFRIVPVTGDDGDVFAAMGVSQDVTDEMDRERELRETKQRLDVALEETDTGVWVLDDEAETVTAFGTTTELFDVDSSTDYVETYLDSIHPEDRPAVEAALERSRSEGPVRHRIQSRNARPGPVGPRPREIHRQARWEREAARRRYH